jgi:hypothetical protein
MIGLLGDWHKLAVFPVLYTVSMMFFTHGVALFMSEQLNDNKDKVEVLDDAQSFERLFTIDEAAATVPQVSKALKKAQRELIDLKESLILSRRLMTFRRIPKSEQAELFNQKREQFERTYHKWIRFFSQQGILLRDLDRGMVDFPYRAETTGDYYFLSWNQGDEGLFYFHEIDDDQSNRIPITLLPE